MPHDANFPADRGSFLDKSSFMDDDDGMNAILFYTDVNDRTPFKEWRLKMRDGKAKIALERRLICLESGHFGDCKSVRGGVWELRIDVGAGYRVHYAKTGSTIILPLCGGDKSTQQTDIDRACEYWDDWKSRKDRPECH